MATRKRKAANLLAHKKATVALHRNGLSIEVSDVTAEDAAQVAAALLDAVRQLSKHYDELIPDAGGVHAGPLGDFPEDEEYVEDGPIQARRRLGFTA